MATYFAPGFNELAMVDVAVELDTPEEQAAMSEATPISEAVTNKHRAFMLPRGSRQMTFRKPPMSGSGLTQPGTTVPEAEDRPAPLQRRAASQPMRRDR
jgi:hypothetical protein